MCSRTHASPALGRRTVIGAMVNTRSISSSASAAAPSPPEAAAAAPRRTMQQGGAWGRCARAEGRWWASGRASQRTHRREGSGGVRSPCRGGRSLGGALPISGRVCFPGEAQILIVACRPRASDFCGGCGVGRLQSAPYVRSLAMIAIVYCLGDMCCCLDLRAWEAMCIFVYIQCIHDQMCDRWYRTIPPTRRATARSPNATVGSRVVSPRALPKSNGQSVTPSAYALG